MQIYYSGAFDKICGLVNASVQQLDNISKPQLKFLLTVFELWLGLPVRYTMLNIGRFGRYSEKSIGFHFEQFFDFVLFNALLIKKSCGKLQYIYIVEEERNLVSYPKMKVDTLTPNSKLRLHASHIT